ncbi:M13 family peptidase [Polymorphobacter sp. PAMC 29334]|uniref:M13 family metallopeptidase n=1 Tax=Polymorphobacter sp. PAMC 29334 TaxID=2862331 RepID=UPI001C770078|nr:M13-type metalloendopeptidase [Polymorphobacter sp. PAMC 29334]QYE35007.1 M13 family peptidase [Polymorphobacter sp. PAMC 29334]
MRSILLLGAALLVVAAAPAKPTYGDYGFDAAGMDRSVTPGNDWGRFANGKYLDDLVIPDDRSNYGMFTKLRDLSQERTRGLVEAAAATNAPAGTEGRKIGDYYASFMDAATIEKKGLVPLQPRLDAIAAIGDRAKLAATLGDFNREGIDAPVNLRLRQDLKNPDIYSVYIGQGGLGMPDRDYYLDTKNPKFAEVRTKYQAYVTQLLSLAGVPDAAAKAKMVYDLEAKLAAVQWSRVERRQVDKTYNPVATAELAAKDPGLDWTSFLAAAGVASQPQIIVTNPSAIAGTAKLVADEPLDGWQAYLTFHTLDRWAPLLPAKFVDAKFAFSGTVLSGQPVNQERWKRGVDATSDALGEAVGKLYVAKYFAPDAKAKADALVKNIIAAMDARLANLTWMDPATKVQARAKLAVFTPKIGYPSKWRDYSNLEVLRGDALGNAQRAARFEFQRDLDKLGKTIDRSEWGMTPMTVNAYANPTWNEVVFPAAILQPPFFDPNADPAVNYGGIGAVIGHEISHHFDDQGRKYDKRGTLADWWTAQDIARFKVLTDKVVAQYAAYQPLPGLHINGELTLGENMADLAGINVAYDAYHKSLNGKPAPVIDGMTGDQRFFLGFAQIWRQKYRDAALLQQTTTDPHTAGFLRPNVARNLDAWYAAFGAKPGETLYLSPEERIKVW